MPADEAPAIRLYYAHNRPVLYPRRYQNSVEFKDLASGRTSVLFAEDGPMGIWLTASPDDRWVLYHRHESATSELMMVEGFR